MALPVALLIVAAAGAGFLGPQIAAGLGLEAPHHSLASMAPALGVVALGVLLAWVDFGRAAAPRRGFLGGMPALERLFINGWYVDTLYQAVIVRSTIALAVVLHLVETRLFDGGFDRLGLGIFGVGRGAARLQGGWVQYYGGWAVILVALAAMWFAAGGG